MLLFMSDQIRKFKPMTEDFLEQMVGFVEDTLKEIVDFPDEVKVLGVMGKESGFLEIHSNSKDHGRILGPKGHTIKSIRGLLIAQSQRLNTRAPVLDVITDGKPKSKQQNNAPIGTRNREDSARA